ncbi:ketopantoate reductase family protein [Paraburkholderia sp. ZP32-5]|uniref:ketopantoate reductase family protein n=1 Tax=Paraburkholderia sp. ZP32-5 TaxID=2883245 RepID=UPI001F3230F1|nr:2-dehydropantoate 2-reductase [Paraburkholderia sp. ZP32-5]
MKICVFGAGAIGGLIAARLAASGTPVSVVARGAHLQAIQRRGLIWRERDSERIVRVEAAADGKSLGTQDYVIVSLKSNAFAAAWPALEPLIGEQTVIVPAMNGVPWWFFHRFGGKLAGMTLDDVDPHARLATHIDVARVLGCVIYLSARVPEPGVVEHMGREDIELGEPDGSMSARAERLRACLASAGFTCRATADIRSAIWNKLIGNAGLNPVAALTHATLDRILDDHGVRTLLLTAMDEVIAVGNSLGLKIRQTASERLEMGRSLGAVEVSMLQDIKQGRPLEYEALCAAVVQIGERAGIPVPTLRALTALIRLRARQLS